MLEDQSHGTDTFVTQLIVDKRQIFGAIVPKGKFCK